MADQTRYVQLVNAWRMSFSSEAWREIWESLQPYLTNFVRKQFGIDDDTLHDLINDIIVDKIIPNLSKYDETASAFTTWACGIARNHVIDWRRRPATQREIPTDIRGEITEELAPTFLGLLSEDERIMVYDRLPFGVPLEAQEEVEAVFVSSSGVSTARARREVEDILNSHALVWKKHGNIQDFTTYLFALIRWVKYEPADAQRLVRKLLQEGTTSPIALIGRECGFENAAKMVVMFGGMRLPLPSPVKVIKRAKD